MYFLWGSCNPALLVKIQSDIYFLIPVFIVLTFDVIHIVGFISTIVTFSNSSHL